MQTVARMETRLGPDFWPRVREGFQRLGSVGLMVCGPGLHAKLASAGVRADRLMIDPDRPDREMTLTSREMDRAIRVIVGFEGRLSDRKRSSRQPRCDFVGAADFGQDWHAWFQQFPVVGRVRGSHRRRLASVNAPMLNVGKTRPLPPG